MKESMHQQLLADLVAIFREEATDSLDELRQRMESLVDGFDPAQLEECLRLAHNLKGASATVGFDGCSRLAFALEEFFLHHVDLGRTPSDDLTIAAFGAVGEVERLVHGAGAETDVRFWRSKLGLAETSTLSGAPSEGQASLLSLRATAESTPQLNIPPVRLEPELRGTPALNEPKPAGSNGSSELEAATKFVRVDTGRLDELLRLSSELLGQSRRMLSRRTEFVALSSELGDMAIAMGSPELGNFVQRFEQLIEQELSLSTHVSGMANLFDDAMKRLRMTRLEAALSGFRRVVAEAGNRLNKEVRLTGDVSSVEIDRHVLERLQMPIIHLLRNAVAHGIESPEERFERGKPRRGEISLTARLRGAFIVLSVGDDGAGIDIRKIARVAVQRGLIDGGRAEQLGFDEAAELLFRSGFSTTTRADMVSGRGVGLADVRAQVEKLGGSVRVEQVTTFPGGTRFVLEFPVSVLSTRGLLVREGGQARVIPLQNVERTLRVAPSELLVLEGERALRTADGALVPFRTLAQLMGECDAGTLESAEMLDVVLLEAWGRRLAVSVEQVQWDTDVVIKPMPWNLRAHPHTAGIAQLGDGSIALVVDPRRFGQANLPATPRKQAQRVLVVDDSLTRRTLHHNLMRSAGYLVDSAADGVEAWEMLQNKRFDVLVSDIQMPRLDGIELTKRVRSTSALRDLPIVLVTGLTERVDEERGLEAGANAYVRKQDFAHERLLETVTDLLRRAS